jgi:predicted phosphodiesterase
MKLALFSDLHLEHHPWVPPPLDVDLVILAGDIGRHTHGLAWAARTFGQTPGAPKVIYTAGNHEYYDAHLGLISELQSPVWARSGVEFLERRCVVVGEVRILGCTLWSGFTLHGADRVETAMSDARYAINDYWMIHGHGGKRLRPIDTLKLHRTAVRWLDAALTEPFAGRTIVVTHFAPHRACVAARHQSSAVSPYFVTDLAWLMEKHRIDLWCHGHTHTNVDFVTANGCRVVSNQRGYPRETDIGFRPDWVIEV